jgi:hypothetical protein
MEFLALIVLLALCFASFLEEQIEKKTVRERIRIRK